MLKEDEEDNLEFVKMLPHVWDNSKQIRFFAYDYDEMNEISKYLEEELQNRLKYENKDYKSFAPYYLIITNDYKKIENLKIITEVLKTKVNLGFSILCITKDLNNMEKNFNNEKYRNTFLQLIAALLFLIGGIIYLVEAISERDIEEIGFI